MTQTIPLIDVRQLKEQTADVLRRVDEDGETIDVIDDGRTVARLIPVSQRGEMTAADGRWQRRRQLAEEIGQQWIDHDISAADAVAAGRRDV